MTPADVAGRASIGIHSRSGLEAGRDAGFENVVSLAMVPGRIKELEGRFLPKLDRPEDVRRYEHSTRRQRTRREPSHA
ncbi:hypothetical protein BKK81_20200 [Cupriavidus sp. USMAHM13]|nr:hypothetical protein BKK81_20200 [Cupriavidus sp. USMAHM13]